MSDPKLIVTVPDRAAERKRTHEVVQRILHQADVEEEVQAEKRKRLLEQMTVGEREIFYESERAADHLETVAHAMKLGVEAPVGELVARPLKEVLCALLEVERGRLELQAWEKIEAYQNYIENYKIMNEIRNTTNKWRAENNEPQLEPFGSREQEERLVKEAAAAMKVLEGFLNERGGR